MKLIKAAAVLFLYGAYAAAAQGAQPQQAASAPITVSKAAQFLTGDTWRDRGKLYRLYGVQSCLRGSIAEQANGKKIDCGNISLSHLVALFSAATVTCQPMGYARDQATFVVCGADLNGDTVDIGTALISTGNAFAATDTKGNAVVASYLVAEVSAKMNKTGLWAMTFEHPIQVLLKGNQQEKKP